MSQNFQDAGASGNLGTIIARTVSVANVTGSVIITTPASAGTLASPFAGLMRYVTINTPDLTGTGTATMTIVDAAGGTLFSQAQNESVVQTYGSIVPVGTNMDFVVTANGTQGATGTIVFTAHYET